MRSAKDFYTFLKLCIDIPSQQALQPIVQGPRFRLYKACL